MGPPLAAALLFLAACAPCGADSINVVSLAGSLLERIPTIIGDLQAVRLNDTRVRVVHTVELLVRELVQTVQSGLLRLPDLLHPRTYLGEMLPHVAALGLVALTLVPFLVFPAKVAALILAIVGTFNPDWKLFDSNFLRDI